MQREIKFRAWDKRKNIMRDVECVGSVFSRSEVYDTSNGREWVMNDHIELMQYTGLKDKNGKEIYEGDIVRAKYNTGKELIQDVVFNESRFALHMGSNGCQSWNPMPTTATHLKDRLYCVEVEVIGNIYENQDLLQEVDT